MPAMYNGPEAIRAVQDTGIVARLSDWPKTDYIVFIPRNCYIIMDVKLAKDAAHLPELKGWIGKVSDGEFGPWDASQEEMMREDWILEKI